MTLVSLPVEPRADIAFHPLGEAAVLFDPVRRSVFTLRPAEAVAWCLLSEYNGDVPRTASALAGVAEESMAEPQPWLEAALDQWRNAGLLGAAPAAPPLAEGAEISVPAFVAPDLSAVRRRYRLLGLVVEVTFPDLEAAAAADAVFHGLQTEDAAQIRAALLAGNGNWTVIAEGKLAEFAPRQAQSIPALKLALTRLALGHAAGFAAVHAAAVARGGRAVLLPAPAGSGKSTLAAACTLAGWELLSDDTVVLEEEAGRALLRPLPLALCLKPGSWAPLVAAGADLDGLPVYERLDGRQARYLAVPKAADGPRPMAAVVVPRWRPDDAPARLDRLNPLDAFEALMPQLYPLAGPLDTEAVGRVVALVEGTPCFLLDYSQLPDALRLLGQAAGAA